MRSLAALCLALSTFLAAPAWAQPRLTAQEFEEVARNVDLDEVYTVVAGQYSIPPEFQPVFKEHLATVFASDQFITAFARHMELAQDQLNAGSEAELRRLAQSLSAGWMQETAVRGVGRIPIADQRRFLKHALGTVALMPEDICAANTRGTLDPIEVARTDVQYMISLGPDKAADFLALTRQALFAEIEDNPPFVPLSAREEARAMEAYETAFIAVIEAHPDGDQVFAAIENFDRASDKAVCDLTKLSLEAAFAVPGEMGDLVLRLLSME